MKDQDDQVSNPYLNARRDWDSKSDANTKSRNIWQFVAILCLLITLASVGGLVTVASKSKFIPYILEVDRVGRIQSASPLNQSVDVDEQMLRYIVTRFTADLRTITPDISLQREGILRVYSHLNSDDPATVAINEFLNGDPAKHPFERSKHEMVSVEVHSVLRESKSSLQVEWTEAVRDRKGTLLKKSTFKALITTYRSTPPDSLENFKRNPLGIFVKTISWSKLR